MFPELPWHILRSHFVEDLYVRLSFAVFSGIYHTGCFGFERSTTGKKVGGICGVIYITLSTPEFPSAVARNWQCSYSHKLIQIYCRIQDTPKMPQLQQNGMDSAVAQWLCCLHMPVLCEPSISAAQRVAEGMTAMLDVGIVFDMNESTKR